jgi:hypothetical protein
MRQARDDQWIRLRRGRTCSWHHPLQDLAAGGRVWHPFGQRLQQLGLGSGAVELGIGVGPIAAPEEPIGAATPAPSGLVRSGALCIIRRRPDFAASTRTLNPASPLGRAWLRTCPYGGTATSAPWSKKMGNPRQRAINRRGLKAPPAPGTACARNPPPHR